MSKVICQDLSLLVKNVRFAMISGVGLVSCIGFGGRLLCE
jgi:hypothetical protein